MFKLYIALYLVHIYATLLHSLRLIDMLENYYTHTDKELIGRMGRKLKEIRLEKNISQANLAKKTGMSRNSIYLIENGKSFSIDSFVAILRALESLDKIAFFFSKKEHKLSPLEVFEREKKAKKRASKKRK